MLEKNIKSKLNDIVLKLLDFTIIDENVIDDMDLFSDGGMDSLTFITLVIEIEDSFDITIPDDFLDMNNFRTINKICDIILEILI